MLAGAVGAVERDAALSGEPGEPGREGRRVDAAIIELASQYGLYGYRRIAAWLRDAGWQGGRRARIACHGLAARRAESSTETAGARAVMAERWLLCALAGVTIFCGR